WLNNEKRRNVDSALASAARVSVRCSVHLLRATYSKSSCDRCFSFVTRPGTARVGGRPYPKKCATRHLWSIRFHPQSALSRQFPPRSRLHDRFGPAGPGPLVCCPVSWHLFTGDARRSVDNGRALWQGIRNLPTGRAAFLSANYAVSSK